MLQAFAVPDSLKQCQRLTAKWICLVLRVFTMVDYELADSCEMADTTDDASKFDSSGLQPHKATMRGDSTILIKKCMLVCLLLLATTGCQALEQKVVYHLPKFPRKWNPPSNSELQGLSFENVSFESLDKTKLNGWFVQPACSQVTNVMLYTHGRSVDLNTLKSHLFKFVKRHQVAVFVFDYRGFGKSEGRPDEAGLYQDAAAARNWLIHRTNLPPGDLIVMGRSLGTAVAIDLASREGAKAIILENGITSVPDVVQYHSHGLISGKRILDACYDSKSKIGQFSGPVFISHCKEDKTVPFSHGVKLAESATSASRVHFVELDGGHRSSQPEFYHAKLNEFLHSL